MADYKCPACLNNIAEPKSSDYGRKQDYNCRTCGPFSISENAIPTNIDLTSRAKLSGWIKDHQENSLEPQITSDVYKLIVNMPSKNPLEKQLLLLRAIEKRTSYPGDKVVLQPSFDYPLAWASNDREFGYLLTSLDERGFIKCEPTKGTCLITTSGWEYLDKHTSMPAFKDRAFVAMSFDETLNDAWENGMKTAVEKAGYKPHRVDKEPHLERIDAKIIADIKDSLFLIADVTYQRQGVYFEAGYALGLKLPVIWCVKKDELEKVHFDTRQYNHVVWESPNDLQEQLYNFICAVIGKRSRQDHTE